MSIKKSFIYSFFALLCFACEVPNDIPYPVVEARIAGIEVEGQCDAQGSGAGVAEIDRLARKVKLYVCDTVDISRLRVESIELRHDCLNPDVEYKGEMALRPDSVACLSYGAFPRKSFDSPGAGHDTRVNFSDPVSFTLSTYQDYRWTVSVEQVVPRQVEVENQVGDAVIDAYTHNVVVYVKKEQSLKRVKVKKFSIGGPHGHVVPDPLKEETSDFYFPRTFQVRTGWGEMQTWNVMVYHTEARVGLTATAFGRTVDALVSGTMPNDAVPVIEYQTMGESQWRQVPEQDVSTALTTYSAKLRGLSPATTYAYRVQAGGNSLEPQTFTTTQKLQIPNASFDDWCEDENNAKLLYPWASGDTPYWETGNKGATTVGSSNSVPTDDTSTGTGKAAYLESRYIVVKFAAGNIFTGTYLRTDGTNGILGFGRPFSAFPSALSFDYKFFGKPVNKVGEESMRYLEGRPDSCQIYIALWHISDDDWEEYKGEKYPLVIRTRPSERHLFSPDDPRVVAYAQLTQGADVPQWTRHTIQLHYKDNTRVPTHIQVVAASSKYGDFFTGGVGTCLYLDNLELKYE